jgi:hypothetical protein
VQPGQVVAGVDTGREDRVRAGGRVRPAPIDRLAEAPPAGLRDQHHLGRLLHQRGDPGAGQAGVLDVVQAQTADPGPLVGERGPHRMVRAVVADGRVRQQRHAFERRNQDCRPVGDLGGRREAEVGFSEHGGRDRRSRQVYGAVPGPDGEGGAGRVVDTGHVRDVAGGEHRSQIGSAHDRRSRA